MRSTVSSAIAGVQAWRYRNTVREAAVRAHVTELLGQGAHIRRWDSSRTQTLPEYQSHQYEQFLRPDFANEVNTEADKRVRTEVERAFNNAVHEAAPQLAEKLWTDPRAAWDSQNTRQLQTYQHWTQQHAPEWLQPLLDETTFNDRVKQRALELVQDKIATKKKEAVKEASERHLEPILKNKDAAWTQQDTEHLDSFSNFNGHETWKQQVFDNFEQAVREKTVRVVKRKVNSDDFFRLAVTQASGMRLDTDHRWNNEDTRQLPVYRHCGGDKRWLEESRLMTPEFNEAVETAAGQLATGLLSSLSYGAETLARQGLTQSASSTSSSLGGEPTRVYFETAEPSVPEQTPTAGLG
ncbi:MAG: hypothetical protein MHM6MM_007992 [Cercozoa sp. M6MM]